MYNSGLIIQNGIKCFNFLKFICRIIASCGFYIICRPFVKKKNEFGVLHKKRQKCCKRLFIAFNVDFFINYVFCSIIEKFTN